MKKAVEMRLITCSVPVNPPCVQILKGKSGKLLSCFGGTNVIYTFVSTSHCVQTSNEIDDFIQNTITHSDSKAKTESSFVWIVPAKYSGLVSFR